MRVPPYMRISTEEQVPLRGIRFPSSYGISGDHADEKGWQVVAEETYDTATA